ncbi:MAG: reverse transcriptase family protein [Candidatus Thiodiazotropha endolucinida]|nr:reverse transcriptase family protein [Candidatus Thiodiazotropha taylori]MCW4343373.1 reverse transcriptase family protein [Candidatus Thiodiazotropha endolucinida]
MNIYKAARNKATYELKQSKYHYEKSLATKIKTDPKIFWKYVRSKAKTKSTVSKLQMDGGLLSTNDQETATTLNNYFTTVFEKEPDGPLPHFTERTYNQVLENIEITESKIGKVVDALNASKSQGPDDFHPKYLKETKEQLTYPLKVIFEKSLNEGKLPDEWKKANVSAIFKSGEKQKPENYRPISLTSVPGKVMEKIIRNAIVQHMTDNNLFNPSQHGFIKGKSCLTQLLEFIEDVSQAIDDGYNVDVIYLDFKKAFDKVPHQRLLLKLQNYGIKGQVYEWVKDFLSDRVQRVMVNGTPSEWAEVSSGIPQGSVLGPILFLVYINDMPDVIAVLIKLYADDAKIYNRVSITDRNNQVQTSLDNSVDWANEWLMYYNFKKCHHLQIGRQEIDSKYSMKAGNETHELNKVKNEKDLGVIIDSNLLFRDHITSKVNLANRNLGIIFRSFTFIDQDMFLHLYKSLVRPHIEYASPVWSPHFKKDSIMIENVQRRATRLVRSLKGYSYSERLRKLGLPTLEYRRERADLIQVYKILNNIDILDKDKLFTVVQRATRGHSFKLYKRRSRLVSRANCFSNRVINSWNSLPETVVCAPSVNAFKNRLNNHWRGHPYKFEAACYQAGQVNRNVNYLNAPQEAEGLLYGVDDR